MELTDKTIVPRNISFGISKNPTRHWAGGDPITTSLIDCLSIFLPEGEKFFIRSLKHYLPHIKNEEVRAEIRGYSTQEAFHTREHQDYNESLRMLGYDVDAMEQGVRKSLRKQQNPAINLAVTCAIEHITMSYSMVTLANPKLFENAPAAYERLWTWHAVEELEHSAVSLDVYDEVTAHWPAWKRYVLRVSSLTGALATMARLLFKNMASYARRDGTEVNFRFWMKVLWALAGRPGFVRKALPNLLRYYLPGYRPKPRHFAKLLKRGREYIGREIPELGHDSVPIAG